MKLKFTIILLVIAFPFLKAQTLTDSLQAWYPLNSTVNDVSGNNLNATNNGATLSSDRFGNVNAAFQFNGSSSTIALPSDFDYEQRSISMWINISSFPSLPNYGTLYDSDHDALLFGKTAFTVYTEGGIKKISYNYGNTLAKVQANLNTWYLITTTVSDSARSYICDNLISTRAIDLIHSSSGLTNVSLGCNRMGQAHFTGKIDDVRIYNRALKKDEIYQLCNTAIGINSVTNSEEQVLLIPQPAKDKVEFNFPKTRSAAIEVTLYNIRGEFLKTNQFLPEQAVVLDISELPTGLYLYKCKGNTFENRGKLSVSH